MLDSALDELLDGVDASRRRVCDRLDPMRRSELGQFLTPSPIARFMAAMFSARTDARVLEAGAGVGSLLAAFVAAACRWQQSPRSISAVAYEIDDALAAGLRDTLGRCDELCTDAGVALRSEIRRADFIADSARLIADRGERFNCTILNPPYRKIHSDSATRRELRSIGIETSNLYTAFLGVAVKLLEPGGELVAITPRSFCNGPYFRPFRELFLDAMAIQRIHVFESRRRAFRDDDVLQENIIVHAVKRRTRSRMIVSASAGAGEPVRERIVDAAELVHPGDPERFIRIVDDGRVPEQMRACSTTLRELGLEVSTGRVVDFRARPFLRKRATAASVPLVYPGHVAGHVVRWPREPYRKPNALAVTGATQGLLLPRGTYVVVKRFTTKDERRRVVAALCELPDRVAFENHLNVFHVANAGLPKRIAHGLVVYLNSTLVDRFVRQFNGHTQVNATDLRNLTYPTREQLVALGARRGNLDQDTIDGRVGDVLGHVHSR